ncbi:MAG: MFS transporter, partial [Verrucomicrobiaceae bacterium]
VVSPLYIAEIAPAEQRGRLAGLFQFNIVFGIVAAFGSNAALSLLGPDAWRWMLGVVAIPSLVYTVLCLSLPESPRWLITRRGDRETAIQVLRQIQPLASDEALDAKAEEIASSAVPRQAAGGFWSAGLRKPITMAFLIAFFNQVSGINAVLYFAPRIFELTGLGTHAAMLTSIGIGFTNLVFTFTGLWLIDRLGRRALLTLGSFGYIVSLGLTAWAFFTGHFSIVPACIFLFIAAHAIGSGTVIWVFISEIFPNQHRASGQALGSGTHWVFAALITTFFPTMMKQSSPGWVFSFFCGMMVVQLLWVRFAMPETKGTVLEDVQAGLH